MSIEALVEWAVARGAYLDPIEIRVGADGNRSVFARRSITPGEVILAVPRALVIGGVDVAATPLGAAIANLAPLLHSRYMPAAVWIALECRAATSPWRPYLAALPAFTTWSPSSMAVLAGTRAGELIRERVRQLADDCALLTDLLGDEMAQVSESELEWGLRIARSRCFEVEGVGGLALIPIADMLDHAAVPDATWSYDAVGGVFEMRATRSLVSGDEIRHNYGTYANANWLAGYGFALENNPDDEVSLRLEADAAPLRVGTRFDARFQRAWAVASQLSAAESRDVFERIAEAAIRARELIASSRDDTAELSRDMRRTCQIVRSGERAVLTEIEAFARRAGEVTRRPIDEQRATADAIAENATGADRLLRGFLRATFGA